MNKKLIALLIALAVLLAGAIGVVVYLESNSPEEGTPSTEGDTAITTAPEDPTEEIVETTEETVGISLPTEDPDEVSPEATFGADNEVPAVTVDPDVPATTEDPDANETPEVTIPGQ